MIREMVSNKLKSLQNQRKIRIRANVNVLIERKMSKDLVYHP